MQKQKFLTSYRPSCWFRNIPLGLLTEQQKLLTIILLHNPLQGVRSQYKTQQSKHAVAFFFLFKRRRRNDVAKMTSLRRISVTMKRPCRCETFHRNNKVGLFKATFQLKFTFSKQTIIFSCKMWLFERIIVNSQHGAKEKLGFELR